MKKILSLLILVFIISMAGIAQKNNASTAKTACTEEVNSMLDMFYLAYNTKDIKAFTSFLTPEGLYCGTDSKELWDKTGYVTLMTATFADPAFAPNIHVMLREIRLSPDGNSAIVVDQFFLDPDNLLAVRQVIHLVKSGNKWLSDFISTSFVPDNSALNLIYDALKW